MADVDQTLAAQIKVPQAPDVIGQINSLAQLQYLAAQGQKVAADAALANQQVQVGAGNLQSLQSYDNLIKGGTSPEEAMIKSGRIVYDPSGSNMGLQNVRMQRELSANRGYAAANPSNPLAIGGPEYVGKEITNKNTEAGTAKIYSDISGATDLNQGVAKAATDVRTVGPTDTVSQGPAAWAVRHGQPIPQLPGLSDPSSQPSSSLPAFPSQPAAAPGQGAPQTMLYAQLGTLMASDPSPAGRAKAAAIARQGGASETDIQRFATLPDPQYVSAGQHFMQASHSPERYQQAPAVPQNPSLQPSPGPSAAGGPIARTSTGALVQTDANGRAVGSAGPATPPPLAGTAAAGPNYYSRVYGHESGGNPTAGDPNHAYGLGQFMPATWEGLRAAHPELGLSPATRVAGTDGRADPVQVAKAMRATTADNAAALANAGVPVTDKNVFMAHFLGTGGALKFFQAAQQNPEAVAASVFPKEAAANPTLFWVKGDRDQPRSLNQLYGLMTRSFGPGNTTGNAPAPGTASIAPGVPGNRPTVPSGAIPNAPAIPGSVPALPAGLEPPPAVPRPIISGTGPVAPPRWLPGSATLPTVPQPQPAPAAPAAPGQGARPLAAAAGATPPPTGLPADQTRPLATPGQGGIQPTVAGHGPATAAQLPAGYQPVDQGIGAAALAGQEQLAKYDNDSVEQYQGRQVARQRLQAISHILEGYQPGAFAEEKADIAAGLHALGIPVSADNLKDAASFQEFTKDTIANIFSDLKSVGGHPLVAEIEGLGKSSPNPSMQPGANQAIIGQGLGLLDYADRHAEDYFSWRKANPSAPNTADFDFPWSKQHSPATFVDAARKNIAVRGLPVPAPAQRTVGQLYVTPKGTMRWMGNGWLVEQR